MIAPIVGVKVALDASLWIENEAVVAKTGCEVTNVVDDHAVEPANAIFSGKHEFALPVEGVESGGVAQSGEFGGGISEGRQESGPRSARSSERRLRRTCHVKQ